MNDLNIHFILKNKLADRDETIIALEQDITELKEKLTVANQSKYYYKNLKRKG